MPTSIVPVFVALIMGMLVLFAMGIKPACAEYDGGGFFGEPTYGGK